MKDFRSLAVWQKSHDLTLSIYRETNFFPKEEMYGLTSQIRRSCASIPTNIAEGCGRGSNTDFQRFLQIAYGSANELDYQLLLARDLKFVVVDRYDELNNLLLEIKRMLASLIRKIQAECR